MRAIVGCLLMVTGAVSGAQQLIFDGPAFWAALVAVTIGIALLLRTSSSERPHGDNCQTCRGAGTVYTAEYNDWRQTGPIRTIRELCPACEGLQRT